MENKTDKRNLIREKTYKFSLQIIALYKQLKDQNEYVLSKQILRSGTSIGANTEEATAAQSRKDFISKMSIASKEARETNYWLRLLRDSKLLKDVDYDEILTKSEEIIRILTSIVKSSQKTSNKNN